MIFVAGKAAELVILTVLRAAFNAAYGDKQQQDAEDLDVIRYQAGGIRPLLF